jgi:hypothetical protein
MENSRQYVFTEYLSVSQSAHGLQAFQRSDASMEPEYFDQVLQSTFR